MFPFSYFLRELLALAWAWLRRDLKRKNQSRSRQKRLKWAVTLDCCGLIEENLPKLQWGLAVSCLEIKHVNPIRVISRSWYILPQFASAYFSLRRMSLCRSVESQRNQRGSISLWPHVADDPNISFVDPKYFEFIVVRKRENMQINATLAS